MKIEIILITSMLSISIILYTCILIRFALFRIFISELKNYISEYNLKEKQNNKYYKRISYNEVFRLSHIDIFFSLKNINYNNLISKEYIELLEIKKIKYDIYKIIKIIGLCIDFLLLGSFQFRQKHNGYVGKP